MDIPLRAHDGSLRASAIVDPEDFERFGHLRWHLARKRYAARQHHHMIYMHRAILGLGPGDKRQADHINGDKLDNRRANLRIVTNAQNKQNLSPYKNNTSGYRGVYWCKHNKAWVANLYVDNRHVTVGYFRSAEEANVACVAAREQLMPFSVG